MSSSRNPASGSVAPLVDGRYRLTRLLYEDTRSVLYSATCEVLATRVTVQFLKGFMALESWQLCLKEALSAVRLRHPGVVALRDHVRAGSDYCLVFEELSGQPLSAFPAASLSPAQTLKLLEQACQALGSAHAAGLCHLTLSPHQFWVTRTAGASLAIQLLGFGLHCLETSAGTHAQYRAPEQLRNRVVDARTDIWSLGVLLYGQLTGALPFEGENLRELTLSVISKPPRPLEELLPHASRGLASALARCLQKRPADRFQSVEELWQALADVPELRSSGVALRTEGPLQSSKKLPPTAAEAPADRYRDAPPLEEVQVTLYRPKRVAPERWYDLLSYVHLAGRRPDAPADAPDPVAEVQRRAHAVLAGQAADYRATTQDGAAPLPKHGEVRLVPEISGVRFNPPSRSFRWQEEVHEERFRFAAGAELEGKTARGFLRVYVDVLLLAEVPVTLAVDANAGAASEPELVSEVRPFRKVFASYSHDDAEIVERIRRVMHGLGFQYLIDVNELRAGERWNEGLMKMIRESDAFQLFWSSNSMRSEYCRQEWEYALSLSRPGFVRPVYWELPLPADVTAQLPPPRLAELHFSRLCTESVAAAIGSEASPSPPRTEELSSLAPLAPVVPQPAELAPPGVPPRTELAPDTPRPMSPAPGLAAVPDAPSGVEQSPARGKRPVLVWLTTAASVAACLLLGVNFGLRQAAEGRFADTVSTEDPSFWALREGPRKGPAPDPASRPASAPDPVTRPKNARPKPRHPGHGGRGASTEPTSQPAASPLALHVRTQPPGAQLHVGTQVICKKTPCKVQVRQGQRLEARLGPLRGSVVADGSTSPVLIRLRSPSRPPPDPRGLPNSF